MNTLSHGSHRRGSDPFGMVSVISFSVSAAVRRLFDFDRFFVFAPLFGLLLLLKCSNPIAVLVDVMLGELGSLPMDASCFGISAVKWCVGAFGDKCDGTISPVCGVCDRLYGIDIRLSGMSGENGGTVSA